MSIFPFRLNSGWDVLLTLTPKIMIYSNYPILLLVKYCFYILETIFLIWLSCLKRSQGPNIISCMWIFSEFNGLRSLGIHSMMRTLRLKILCYWKEILLVGKQISWISLLIMELLSTSIAARYLSETKKTNTSNCYWGHVHESIARIQSLKWETPYTSRVSRNRKTRMRIGYHGTHLAFYATNDLFHNVSKIHYIYINRRVFKFL